MFTTSQKIIVRVIIANIYYLLCERHCSKHIICINSFNPHINLKGRYHDYPQFRDKENEDPYLLLKVKQLINERSALWGSTAGTFHYHEDGDTWVSNSSGRKESQVL